MSAILTFPTRAFVSAQNRLALRNEDGQATAEYGVVILVAVALGIAVLALFKGGAMDAALDSLLKHVLKLAQGMIK